MYVPVNDPEHDPPLAATKGSLKIAELISHDSVG